MPEPDQIKWVGIRPTDPPEDIPVEAHDSWVAQGSHTAAKLNPVADTVHFDTGPLTAGYYDFVFYWIATDHALNFLLEHRNAANDAYIHPWFVMTEAKGQQVLYLRNWKMGANERFRLINQVGKTLTIYSGVFWTRRS